MGVQDIAPSFNNPPTFNDLNEVKKYLKDVVSKVAIALNELDFMVNGTLDANNIKANSIETKNLKAGSVTADKIQVTELSAISANLGHIVAGLIESIEIYGSYIATAQGTYPRCEMSSTNNLFGAYGTSSRYINIIPDTSGIPIMELRNGIMRGFIEPLINELFIATAVGTGNIEVSSGVDLRLHAQGQTIIDSWSKIYSNGDGQTLQTALNSKATAGNSTGTAGGTTLNGGIPIGTQLMVNGGGTVTWAGVTVPVHSHAQT